MNALYRMNRKAYIAYCDANSITITFADYQDSKEELGTIIDGGTTVEALFESLQDEIATPPVADEDGE